MYAILKYPGSKWSLTDWIVSKLPKHHTYVEPFFGSGAVFFNKRPSPIEVINDIDDDVYMFFKMARDNPDALAAAISMTPYSRKEFDEAWKDENADNDIEKVRRFLVRTWQGHGFRTDGKPGWKNDVIGREQMYAAFDWYKLPGRIHGVVDRLKQVQIENRPALDVIDRFNHEGVLIYADPPYIINSRVGKQKQYRCEMTDSDHVELLRKLLAHKGNVILSGYDNDLYNETLKGWTVSKVKAQAQNGAKRQEMLWMNFEPSRQFKFEIMSEG